MATYADLKARIVAETGRDDLTDELASILDIHVADAVAKYSLEPFWFNQKIGSATTVANTGTVAVPAGFRTVNRVVGLYGDLRPISLGEIVAFDNPAHPIFYAWHENALRLYATPDAAYTLTVYGLSDIPAPAIDADTNVWTNEAARLIAAEVRMTLNRDVFMDNNAAGNALMAVNEALQTLRHETARRQGVRPVMRQVRDNGTPLYRRLGV